MPIYEFYCEKCNTLFNFFSCHINTTKQPNCPKCDQILQRQISTFATIGKAKETDDDFPLDIDESKMESVLSGLASEAENINEDDPRQAADLMRKLTDMTGLELGDGINEALSRMEKGEDPETVEAEMGDLLEGEDPFVLAGTKSYLMKK